MRDHDAPEATDPTPGEVRLSEADKTVLLDVAYAYANPFDDDNPTPEWDGLVATVERIVAARLAARDAEHADKAELHRELEKWEALAYNNGWQYDRAVARAEAAEAEVADLRAASVELLALKDGPRDTDYERRKPAAWEALRAALGGEHAWRDCHTVCKTTRPV